MVKHAYRRGRIELDTHLAPCRFNRLSGAVRVRARFWVEGDNIGAGLGKGRNIIIDRGDHQMHVEWLISMRLDDRTGR